MMNIPVKLVSSSLHGEYINFIYLHIPVTWGSSSILVKISYFVLIRKIGMIKNRLILTETYPLVQVHIL
jgi:hypothetical protein